MTKCGVSPHGAAACSAAMDGESSETNFNAALLREQYRSLARLGPYVHGVVILATVALFCATAPSGGFLDGLLLPALLISLSSWRLVSWLKVRARMEVEALDLVRRRVRMASILGSALALTFTVTTAISAWRYGAVKFALVLLAVWVVAAVCAICLNRIGRGANVIVAAATAPLIIAFLARDAAFTLCLAALIAIAATFVIRILDEHFRMFAEMVRSRFLMGEKQRAAEEGRRAAMAIAFTDDLTGLPNRRCFQSLLADKIGTSTQTGEPFALGLIDLDGFKPINDAHGHPVGDEVLKQVAKRLARAMDGRGSAARIGGDEFAILCDRVGAWGEALALGEEIQRIFATPFAAEFLSVRLSGACGFALFPSSASEQDELVRQADAALYRDKACGRASTGELDVRTTGAATEKARPRAIAQFGVPFGPIADFAAAPAALDRLRA